MSVVTHTASLSAYTYAADLHQWIPFYNQQVELYVTARGQYRVLTILPWTASLQSAHLHHPGRSRALVFNKDGILISSTPSKRALRAGAAARWPKLWNVQRVTPPPR